MPYKLIDLFRNRNDLNLSYQKKILLFFMIYDLCARYRIIYCFYKQKTMLILYSRIVLEFSRINEMKEQEIFRILILLILL